MSNEEIYNLISSKAWILFKQLRSRLHKAIIEKEKKFLEIVEMKVEMYPKVISIDDDKLPRFGYLTIKIENKGDIDFEIKRVCIGIDVDVKNIKRRWGRSYPLLRVYEDAKVMETKFNDMPIGHIKLSKSVIKRRETCEIMIEFEIPHWIEDIRYMYIRGLIELQRGVVMEFHKNIPNEKIKMLR